MKKVAIIGTVGVPANYGGFETLVENLIGDNCSKNTKYTVFCSSKSLNDKPKEYKGATLKYIPLNANGAQSIPYDIISIGRAIKNHDTLLILGVSGAFILPLIKQISHKKIIVNIDGLEHRREKWSKSKQKLLKRLEQIAVQHADMIIADNKAIQEYVHTEYGKESKLIAYGGDHVLQDLEAVKEDSLSKYGVTKGNFFFSVCRIEPENNVHLTLEAFSKTDKRIIFVGNWYRSRYGIELKEKFNTYSNIILLDPIYDLKELGVLRKYCRGYIHGHSAGGTNPSLVEAMFFGNPIISYDINYNRETTEGSAHFFKNVTELIELLNQDKLENGAILKEVANQKYIWKKIAKQYESLY